MSNVDRLYHLLPAVYRQRDLEQGEPLRALMAIIQGELERIEQDVATLHDDSFIETCAEWLVPYVGDLLGVTVVGEQPPALASPRSQIANALAYRRRKGTPVVLERVAADVVGWFARVVEFFRFLAFHQPLHQLRPGRGGLFDLRDPRPFERTGTAFEAATTFRSVDVRRIASRRGRYNLPNLGLFLWRLRTYAVDRAARPLTDPADGRYVFDPAGRDVPLFNRPRREQAITRRAEEYDLPVRLRRAALELDLAAYQSAWLELPPPQRPPASDYYYGPDRAFDVHRDGLPVAPIDLVSWDLGDWRRPPTGVRISGPVTDFSGFPAAPELDVTIADQGPHRAVLAAAPTDLEDARTRLEDAIRAAHADFAAARVVVVDDRLLVLPGRDGDLVRFAATATDAVTVDALGLGTALRTAVLGEPLALAAFAAFTTATPTLRALIGTPSTITLAAVPADLAAAAAELEAALQPVAAGAQVEVLGQRLLVTPPTSGDALLFAPAPADATTVAELRLGPDQSRLVRGLFSGTLAPFPAFPSPELEVTFGSKARILALGVVTGDLDRIRAALEGAIRGADPGPEFTAAEVIRIADRLLVRPGVAGTAVAFAATAADPDTVVALELETPPATAMEGLLVTPPEPFPALSGPRLAVTLGGESGVAALDELPVDLVTAAAGLQAAIRAASGDPSFTGAQVLPLADRLLVRSGTPGDTISFATASPDVYTVSELALGSGMTEAVEGIFSGPLAPFPAVSGPRLAVTLGAVTADAVFAGVPTDLPAAAAVLETAIRAADPAPSFAGAQVLVLGDRMLVRPGTPGDAVSVAVTAGDADTAVELALDAGQAQAEEGLFSGPLSPFPQLTRPRLGIIIAGELHTLTLADLPADLAQARTLLETAIRDLDPARPLLAAAAVVVIDDRLMVKPGLPGRTVSFVADAGDATTAGELALEDPIAQGVHGLFSGPLSPFPALARPQIDVTIAATTHTATMADLPADLAAAAAGLEAAIRAADPAPSFAAATVVVAGDQLLIQSGVAGETVSCAAAGADATTAGELALTGVAGARAVGGFFSAALDSIMWLTRPQLSLTIGVHTRTARLGDLPADLRHLRKLLITGLRGASASPATPSPPEFSDAEVVVVDNRILVVPGVAGESISCAPAAADATTAGELLLDAAGARAVDGFFSGPLAPFPVFAAPEVAVTLGASNATARLSGTFPTDLDQARQKLEAAIRGADPAPTFTGAQVLRVDDRLVVLPGVATDTVDFAAGADAATVTDLKLDAPPSEAVNALVSGSLPATISLTAATPQVDVTLGAEGPHTATLAASPTTVAEARTELENAIRAADPSPTFAQARVVVLVDQLLVLAGVVGDQPAFAAAAGDATTVAELMLDAGTDTQGRRSGDLAAFAGLSFSPPEVNATLGTATADVALAGVPDTLAEAASMLGIAIATLDPAATVEVVDSRLLVQPGTPGAAVAFAATAGDAVTASVLLLAFEGFLSGSLAPFPTLSSAVPELEVTLGTATHTAVFGAVPADLASARTELEAAIRNADSAPSFLGAVVTIAGGDRLLVRSGVAGEAVAFAGKASDLNTVRELALDGLSRAGRHQGLLSGDLSTLPALTTGPAVGVTIAGVPGTAVLTSIPTIPGNIAVALQQAIRAAGATPGFTAATVELVGDQLLIESGVAGDSIVFANLGAPRPDSATEMRIDSLTAVDGLLSGILATFPALTIAPAVEATIAGTTAIAVLTTVPADLAAARLALEEAVVGADPAFRDVRVEIFGSRLLVRPRVPGSAVTFAETGAGPDTAAGLALDAAAAVAADGLLSGDLAAFPTLTFRPEVEVTLGAETRTASLGSFPADLATAATVLETAIRAASATAAFTGAVVDAFGDRLRVRSGVAGDAVSCADTGSGPDTATELALVAGSENAAGLLSGALAPFPSLSMVPALDATIGGLTRTAIFTDVPADLGNAATVLEAAVRAADPAAPSFSAARVRVVGDRLLVSSGVAGEAVAFAATGSGPATATELALLAATAQPAEGILSGTLSPLPTLTMTPAVEVTLGGQARVAPFTAIPQDLTELATVLQDAVRGADPGASFTGAVVTLFEDRLWIRSGVAGETVSFADTGSGPHTAAELALDAGEAAHGLVSDVISGSLTSPLGLELDLTIGVEGPYTCRLGAVPADLDQARTLLQSAARGAHTAAAFTAARVSRVGDHLLIEPGIAGEQVTVTPVAGDATAQLLLLDAGQATVADGLLSADLGVFPTLTAAVPQMRVVIDTPRTVVLAEAPADADSARRLLAVALPAAVPAGGATFTAAEVALVGHRLLVLPGIDGDLVSFAPAPPDDLTSVGQLRLDGGRLMAVTGLRSGPLSPFPALSSATPAIDVTIGARTATATLAAVPAGIDAARTLLEHAVRAADSDSAFVDAKVAVAGDRLLLLPGVPGLSVTCAAAAGDATTVVELALDAAAQNVAGALSGEIGAFPAITSAAPELDVVINARRTITLAAVPISVTAARDLLELAVRGADPDPAFTGTHVAVVDNRLLVIAGAGETVRFEPSPDDGVTVVELGLRHRVAVDVERGRLAFAVGDEPLAPPELNYHYGFSDDLGGGPYDRRDTLAEPQADTWQISIPAAAASLQQAIDAWPQTTQPQAVIRITDNAIYEEATVTIDLADGSSLVIEAADGVQPVLAANLTVTGGGSEAVLVINGPLVDGAVELRGSLDLTIEHATLVPEASRDGIWYGGGDPADLRVRLDHAIAGALRLPAGAVALEVEDSIVGALGPPLYPALVSGSLSSFSGLTAPAPELAATLGHRGPLSVAVGGSPTTEATARDQLRTALRAADPGTAFAAAEVVLRRSRLIVIAGTPGPVSLATTAADATTLTELRLDAGNARVARAVVSEPLDPFPSFTAPAPEVALAVITPTAAFGPVTLRLDPPPATLAQARDTLEAAIRAAGTEAAFTEALVATAGVQLVVVPGVAGAAFALSATAEDPTTVAELGLAAWGPPATLARTTVLGTVTMRQLDQASEVLFTGTVDVQRPHLGCVRYSYLPPGGVTPRRFRCQPDLAITSALADQLPARLAAELPELLAAELPAALDDRAAELGLASADELSEDEVEQVRAALATEIRQRLGDEVRKRAQASVQLAFTSLDDGDPAYAQLSFSASEPLRTGAEDGSEIGAFCSLRQPLRQAQLRALIDEYVRFGLEVGLFYVT